MVTAVRTDRSKHLNHSLRVPTPWNLLMSGSDNNPAGDQHTGKSDKFKFNTKFIFLYDLILSFFLYLYIFFYIFILEIDPLFLKLGAAPLATRGFV